MEKSIWYSVRRERRRRRRWTAAMKKRYTYYVFQQQQHQQQQREKKVLNLTAMYSFQRLLNSPYSFRVYAPHILVYITFAQPFGDRCRHSWCHWIISNERSIYRTTHGARSAPARTHNTKNFDHNVQNTFISDNMTMTRLTVQPNHFFGALLREIQKFAYEIGAGFSSGNNLASFAPWIWRVTVNVKRKLLWKNKKGGSSPVVRARYHYYYEVDG